MDEINLSENLSVLRKERGITQEALAGHLGVSKAAVSKWETAAGYPDLSLLPRIAAYFNCTVDELIGYRPQLSRSEIRNVYQKLTKMLETRSMEETAEECETWIRRYYSCFPLLLQMGWFFLNHAVGRTDYERYTDRALELAERVKKESGEVWYIREAALLEAYCRFARKEFDQVARIAGGTVYPMTQETELMAMAFQQMGDLEKSEEILQICLYQHLVFLLGDGMGYLTQLMPQKEKAQELLQRLMAAAEAFEIDGLHFSTAVNLYMIGAQFYCFWGEKEKALELLRKYVDVCIRVRDDLTLHGDRFFDRIDPWLENLPLGQNTMIGKTTVQSMFVTGLKENPALALLKEEPEYRNLVKRLERCMEKEGMV